MIWLISPGTSSEFIEVFDDIELFFDEDATLEDSNSVMYDSLADSAAILSGISENSFKTLLETLSKAYASESEEQQVIEFALRTGRFFEAAVGGLEELPASAKVVLQQVLQYFWSTGTNRNKNIPTQSDFSCYKR